MRTIGSILRTLLFLPSLGGVGGWGAILPSLGGVGGGLLLAACSDADVVFPWDDPEGHTIRMGGVNTEEMLEVTPVASRAQSKDAETVSWLLQPLKSGLDITYGLYNVTPAVEDVAILQLQSDPEGKEPYDKENNLAKYTFTYRVDRRGSEGVDDENNAIWYNNGYHYFQGVYVPERIRYDGTKGSIGEVENTGKAPKLTTEQYNGLESDTEAELGNYRLLTHYLGMPANYRLVATVERIKLPFRHRLARVVAFVLIDPILNTHLKGYNLQKDSNGQVTQNDDPVTTALRFCNVKVLQGVEDKKDSEHSNHDILTPKWTIGRKVIPHFEGELGSYSYKTQQELDPEFKFYYKEEDGRLYESFPTSNDWAGIHNAAADKNGLHNGYTEVNYGKVPVYDIIVRPTYENEENVMYDEENYSSQSARTALARETNSILFEIELKNGLQYEKTFEFDLNANEQTVVYLRISREHVDYNASESEKWIETSNDDLWFGVDNDNGNTLSLAGSSWQRAYRTTLIADDKVTDGDLYNYGENVGQYLGNNSIWADLLFQAHKDGAHHGDYFILDNDITIDATRIPKDFVFTGHLDAREHIINITGAGTPVYKHAESLESLFVTDGHGNYTSWSVPTLYVKLVTPVYYTEDELAEVDGKTYVKTSLVLVPEENTHYTAAEAEAENSSHRQQVADNNGIKPGEDGYTETWGYEDGYTELHEGDVKQTIPEHYATTDGSIEATTNDVKRYDTTYPLATEHTTPAAPTTVNDLETKEYYTDDQGTPFVCPALYQFSHTSPAYLFAGLDGTYTTWQEEADDSERYTGENKLWEANVHLESNDFGTKQHWVPTLGYRAEVINAIIGPGATLFKPGTAYDAEITGNVQNCMQITGGDKRTLIPNHTPAIPAYKN